MRQTPSGCDVSVQQCVAHLLDVAHGQLHEGLQCAVQPRLATGGCIQIRQVSPHPGKSVERCGDVDGVEVLPVCLHNVQNLGHSVSIYNASVDVSVKVRNC